MAEIIKRFAINTGFKLIKSIKRPERMIKRKAAMVEFLGINSFSIKIWFIKNASIATIITLNNIIIMGEYPTNDIK